MGSTLKARSDPAQGAGPWWLPRPPPEPLRGLIERLPVAPPSWLLASALNRVLLPRLDAAAREALDDRVVELHVRDFGLRARLVLGPGRFVAASAQQPASLLISASAQAFWRLAAGEDDADTLFFERALTLEGDTEFGLRLKNTLDALGPLLPGAGHR